MKSKNLSKRLILNKKTIADLNGSEMKNVVGGVFEAGIRCDSVYSTICESVVICVYTKSKCVSVCTSIPCCD